MRSAFIRGRDHHRVGGLELVAEGSAAIALSRGGAKKTYSHTDPNEDCVAFAAGDGGQILIAADGHHGELGSEAAVQSILTEFAQSWTAETAPVASRDAWKSEAVTAAMKANEAILEIAGKHAVPPAPTTFVLTLIRPADDLLLHLSVGDSHVFAVDRGVALDLGGRIPNLKFTPFLGYEEAREELIGRYARIGVRSLESLRAIVLATDGLSEPGIGVPNPPQSVFSAVAQVELDSTPGRRATDLCRSIMETALDSHRSQKAGDNMGCAVVWLGGE